MRNNTNTEGRIRDDGKGCLSAESAPKEKQACGTSSASRLSEVRMDGEWTPPDRYKSGGYMIVRIPFNESSLLIEIFDGGLCNGFYLEDRP